LQGDARQPVAGLLIVGDGQYQVWHVLGAYGILVFFDVGHKSAA
jgi:hypothetical protein